MTEQEQRRMQMAKQFFAEPATAEIRKELEESLAAQWMLSDTTEGREDIWRQRTALLNLFAVLESWTFEGDIAQRTARRLAQ